MKQESLTSRSAATLEAQALGAVNQHMEPDAQPTMEFLESVAEFERHIFSSAKVRKLSAAIDAGRPLPNLDPPLSAFEQRRYLDDVVERADLKSDRSIASPIAL